MMIPDFSGLWAIRPDYLQGLINCKSDEIKSFCNTCEPENNEKREIKGNLALIPIYGAIMSHSNIFTQIFGMSTYEGIREQLNAAMEDEDVSGIIFDIDSPGGVVSGCAELGEEIAKANETKPIIAYTGGLCVSAAYWIASSCEKIIAHKNAYLGAIGCITARSKQVNPNSEGCMNIEIVSSNAKNKSPDPTTEEGIDEIKKVLDSAENIFIEAVASGRKVSKSVVKSSFDIRRQESGVRGQFDFGNCKIAVKFFQQF